MARARKHDLASVEAAEVWLIGHVGKTYRQAADHFGIPVDALRARINNRYGSLAGARTGDGHKREVVPMRRCLCCRESFASKANRICPTCTRRNDTVHVGSV